jgi:hypothetical protein
LKTSWNATVDGRQYFVAVNARHRLEYSFDNVNPLVGGGFTVEVTADLADPSMPWQDIVSVFGTDDARMMLALAAALPHVGPADVENRTAAFYEEYGKRLRDAEEKDVFGAEPGWPSDEWKDWNTM